uniref:Uncharacterized protein n=1 Tax=Rhizophora mucronata TaxID=61149 RepID=A0A2P2N6N6_RHIMU
MVHWPILDSILANIISKFSNMFFFPPGFLNNFLFLLPCILHIEALHVLVYMTELF